MWRIDHLFSTLTPTGCRVPVAAGSDHRPVVAAFRL